MTETDKRRNFLINTAYITVLIGLYYLFMEYAFWLLFPFLFSIFIAMALQKPINYLAKHTKLKKKASSVICVTALLLVVICVISLIGVKLFSEIRGLFSSLLLYVKDWPTFLAKAETTLLHFIRFLPDSFESSISASIQNLTRTLSSNTGAEVDFSMLSAPLSGVWSTAKAVPEIIVAIVISVVACFFMTADYDRIVTFIKRQLPPGKREAVSVTKRTTVSSVGKLAKAYAILMLLTFGEMVLGLNILKLAGLYEGNYLIATAIVVAVVDIVPVLGTGTILIPWAVYSLLTGSTWLGIGLLVLYVAIYIIRQAVEPKLVAANLGLPPILTLIGMYIGVKLFGFIGLFILPLSIMFVKILNDEGIVKLWKNLSKPDPQKPPACKNVENAAASGKNEETDALPAEPGAVGDESGIS